MTGKFREYKFQLEGFWAFLYFLFLLFMLNFSISSIVCLIKNPHQNHLQPLIHFGKTVTWNHNIENWNNNSAGKDTISVIGG